MPAYDFRCKSCDSQFTVRVSISERDKVRCPDCGTSNVKQVLTPFSVTVKGSPGKTSCDSGCGSGSMFG
ncbi:FmdB family zinc ribbon protein [Phosphitispora fastidiosa]|uniref:FmdB family zinc ribbon protein n=1 Tax=Phosphitispora fastidiosa TaxID=2837202 RepID=UPI001E444400|nr:zinc ribbon domain-containing protein [Phosphitispora fastidiosa]MBU7005408.1 putative FmdB family regulatory protein [Phosphitispora fastidiosa]